jgi:hypothetical protein
MSSTNEQSISLFTEQAISASTEISVNTEPLAEQLSFIAQEERRIVLTEWNTTKAC